jgi:prepilin-type N-terminal cleavage/methylation domain-containing protein
MKFKQNKGFTLIELLVVVAIIGILSSIVLVSLNTARQKGRDASAKGSMSSVRAAAEFYFDSRNNYGTVTSATITRGDTGSGNDVNSASSICDYAEVVNLSAAAARQTDTDVDCQVQSGPAGFTATITLNDGQTYCVDSTGYAGYLVDPVDGTPITGGPITPGRGCIEDFN